MRTACRGKVKVHSCGHNWSLTQITQEQLNIFFMQKVQAAFEENRNFIDLTDSESRKKVLHFVEVTRT